MRFDLAARLRARSAEIEKAIFMRIQNLAEPVGEYDPAYVAGLRRAVAEALVYGLEAIETGGESSMPIPLETTRQARRAARERVRLDTVLRRYAAGNKVLEEFLIAEAEGVPSWALCQILNDQGAPVDFLMGSVSAEYRDELERTKRSPVQKRADRVLRFLQSDSLTGPPDLDYDFDHWHVALILTGQGGEMTARALSERFGYRSLHVVRDHETAWAWLGGRKAPEIGKLVGFLAENPPQETSVAIGEPRRGPDGWRQTLREAQVALQVMLCQPQCTTRCRDVILVSAIMRDQALAEALIETYLAPLDGRGGSGEDLRETLRAYFNAGQNAVTAAAALGVARATVERRLRSVEKRLDQTLTSCNTQLQVALRVEELVTTSRQIQDAGRA